MKVLVNMNIVIGDIAMESKTVTPSTKCEEVYLIFEEQSLLEGIVVVENEQSIGLVMKTHFFQKLSTKYGFDLFMKRNISLVMERELLMVDYNASITEVSTLAMNRKQNTLYDFVIVSETGTYVWNCQHKRTYHEIVGSSNQVLPLFQSASSFARK